MIARSVDETAAAGRALASRLTAGDRVLLEGPLGSGKTTFVQGLAEGLGAQVVATSPSFVIVHEYQCSALPTPSVLRHIDLYRLPDPAVDVDRLGLFELLHDPDAIVVIEWADRLPVSALAEVGRLPEAASADELTSKRVVRVQFEYGEQEYVRVIRSSVSSV